MKEINKIVRDVPSHWVGDGFPVRSLFSYQSTEFDPFLLLDYAEPYQFAPASAPRGVGAHPHRGFETVTIVYQGELEHRDSGGNHGAIGPGDVQWMTAAGGVVHEEFHSERFTRDGGPFEVAQLWVNLPAKDKLSSPRYQELLDSKIPRVALPDSAGSVRVIAGEFQGTSGLARTFTPIEVWDVQLSAGKEVSLPMADGHTTVLVVQHGAVTVNEKEEVPAVTLLLLERAGAGVLMRATHDARVLVLSGEPIGEPVAAHGPFVMNTREELQQAFADYQSGRLGQLKPATKP